MFTNKEKINMAKRKRKTSQKVKFKKAAKKCSMLSKEGRTNYQSCMKKELKK